MTFRGRIAPLLVVAAGASAPVAASATPSTTFWAPSTPYVQPFGVAHVGYDTYFRRSVAYPIDLGLEMGVLPWRELQMEVGIDAFFPMPGVGAPIALNGKIGASEDVYFRGQPGWSFGVFGVGFEEDVTNQNVLHAMVGKTLPYVGALAVGGYYGLNEDLFRSSRGDVDRLGLMAGWSSPPIDVPLVDKLIFCWDVLTGRNALGATGGGVYVYFTPAIDLLTGPVFFFEPGVQPNRSSWLWSVQLDVDVDLAPPAPEPTGEVAALDRSGDR